MAVFSRWVLLLQFRLRVLVVNDKAQFPACIFANLQSPQLLQSLLFAIPRLCRANEMSDMAHVDKLSSEVLFLGRYFL